MAWRDNPIGIVIDGSSTVDFTEAKRQGIAFVIAYCGLGYDQESPNWDKNVDGAYKAGIPLVAKYTMLPAIDDYTQPGVPEAQIPWLQKLLLNKKIYGLIIDVTRYWTGFDIETGHLVRVATSANIDYTASEIVNTMAKQLGPKSIQLVVASNDAFVQKYAPTLTAWLDRFGFDLVDNRYRIPNSTTGAYDRYITYGDVPVLKNTLEELRLSLPPIDSKNPLVPGNAPQLKFWECSGTRFMLPFVKDMKGATKAVTVVLWNGTINTLNTWLNFTQDVPPLGDTTKPTAPTQLTGTATSHSVSLTWTPSTDNIAVDHYTLSRNSGVLFDNIKDPTQIDPTVFPKSTYVYSVTAVDAAGNVSDPSDLFSVFTPDDAEPPTPPMDLTEVLLKLAKIDAQLNEIANKVAKIADHFS